jgi:PKD repeat protein
MWPNGTLRWRFNTGGEIHAHPSIADDGTIYIGSDAKYLYALNPNGTMKWKFYIDSLPDGGIAIAEDETIYIGTNQLYAIYPNGTLKWSFNIGSDVWIYKSTPAISADGTIYFGTCIGATTGGEIIAVNPDGTERWRKRIANELVDSSPSIAEDGTVYIGSSYDISSGNLFAFGPGELKVNANGPYYDLTNQPIQFTGTSSGGYSPHSYHWDFGDTHTSEEQNPIHTYINPGNYTVVFTVTDNKSNTATDTTYAWIQNTNTQPDKPTINGPTHGAAGTTYDYKFTVTDPDNSIIYLYVDWGDTSNTGWRGPYNTGQQVTLSHSWSEQNTYTIKAKAKDPYDAEGPEGILDVTMPKNKLLNNPLLLRLLDWFPLLQKMLLYLTK